MMELTGKYKELFEEKSVREYWYQDEDMNVVREKLYENDPGILNIGRDGNWDYGLIAAARVLIFPPVKLTSRPC